MCVENKLSKIQANEMVLRICTIIEASVSDPKEKALTVQLIKLVTFGETGVLPGVPQNILARPCQCK